MESALDSVLAVRLALLEERLVEMKRLLSTPGYRGAFYSLIQDLSSRERKEMETLLEKAILHLAHMRNRTAFPSREEKTSHLLAGMASTTLVSLLELDPKRIRGYGSNTLQYKVLWKEEMEPLLEVLHSLAQITEKARK